MYGESKSKDVEISNKMDATKKFGWRFRFVAKSQASCFRDAEWLRFAVWWGKPVPTAR